MLHHKDQKELLEAIGAIVPIMQRQGQHDFPASSDEQTSAVITLCGLALHIGRERAMRLTAYNIDMSFEYYPLEAANDGGILKNGAPGMAGGAVRFAKGGEAELKQWGIDLDRLHRSFLPERNAALPAA